MASPSAGHGLVTFGLLDEREEPAAPSTFASLFDRMRAAFGTQPERAPPRAPRNPSRTPERARAPPHTRTRTASLSSASTCASIVPLRTVPPPGTSPRPPSVYASHAAHDAAPSEAESELEQIAHSVPGFPLGGDVLDDAQSVVSFPAPRSDADDAISTLGFRPSYPSADAWIRRFRGEGLSRRYWMADETARACRDCLLPFTTLRRRHHCRICGQIFCRRCCSNIVPGTKFGQAHAIRTCNQCLCMLQEYDRREALDAEARAASARSTSSSLAPLTPGGEDDWHTPQAQFAATTLFAHDAHALPRRLAEADLEEGETDGAWGAQGAPPAWAPFRAGPEVEDAPQPLMETSFDEVLPVEQTVAPHTPPPPDPVAPTPREPAPSSPVRRTARQKLMRGASRYVTSTALGAPSLVYFLRMLHQVLVAEHVGDVPEWKETVKLLALSVIERVRMRTRNTALTDIRNFVKIKCLPGGRIADCEFLDGYICTKNVATKRMARLLPVRNARIMVLTFPLEYHRNAHQLMSLEPIMAQEQEFLRILVARILALRPNVVIAEKSVSYYALQLLEEAGVAVFWSMKRSSIEIIARCTQADIVASIDRLALDPRLGRCACLSVDTYVFAHDPAHRKPLLRIEVLSKDVSSALVLRGAPIHTLRRIKAILALMVFVGYNLKVEEHLRSDLGITLDWSVMNIQHGPDEAPKRDADQDAHRNHLLTETLRKYQRLILSASISVILPPPYLVTHMKQVTDRIHALRTAPPPAPSRIAYPLPAGTAAATPAPAPTIPAGATPTQETARTPATPHAHPKPASPAASCTPHTPATPPCGEEPRSMPSVVLQDPALFDRTTERAVLEAERDAMQPAWRSCVAQMAQKLSPFAHQKLVALVRTTCAATQQTCTGPALHTVEYYGMDDEPLGRLLERTVDESGNVCPAKTCDRGNLLHYTTFIHNTMRVQMVVERFTCPLPGEEKQLLCWSYCKVCEHTTPVAHLSEEAWSFSFAKYLELQFYPNPACHPTTCQHDYYRDSVRYFALRNLAIRFHADPVPPWDVVVPPMQLVNHVDKLYALKNEETVGLLERNARYWDSVCARLGGLEHELQSAKVYTAIPALAKTQAQALRLVRRIIAAAHAECADMQRHMLRVYWDSACDLIQMNDVRRVLQHKVVAWDGLFLEFEKRSTVSEREVQRLIAEHLARPEDPEEGSSTAAPGTPAEKSTPWAASPHALWDLFGSRDEKGPSGRPEKTPAEAPTDTPGQAPAASPAASPTEAPTDGPVETPAGTGTPAGLPTGASLTPANDTPPTYTPPRPPAPCAAGSTPEAAERSDARTSPRDTAPAGRPWRTAPPSFAAAFNHRGELMTLRPPWEAPKPRTTRKDDARISRTRVSSLARQFDQLSRDAERERARQQHTMNRTRRARPVTSTHATVEVFKTLRDAVGEESDGESDVASTPAAAHELAAEAQAVAEELSPRTAAADAKATPEGEASPPKTPPKAETPDAEAPNVAALNVEAAPTYAEVVAESEIVPLFARLSEVWTLHCGELVPLAYPFLSSDHVFSDSSVVVREDEPSSIIAFTLHAKAYREQLQAAQHTRARTHGAVPPVDAQSSAAHLRDLEQELRTSDGTHFGYEFDTGSVKLWCKIFFAEQFDALRHMYGCSDTIVQSLSRCFKWDSGGGKSGSAFLKTRDDRLVVKQLSRAEMDGFSKFAPQYFAYVADCKAFDRPTTLTKIFGYFRIGFRNAHTGKNLKLDVVVMENLAYGHTVYKIFDLKGTTRNRLRQETGRELEVLMDENFAQMSHTAPILVREYAKRVLRAALYNDSLFLTDMNVMDYSLIVVLDETRKELVIGIIDYLRTYTWDKRVESFVKETAILGGGGKGEPTVITPRQYRMRFLSFLDRYFWMTPDPWVPEGWVL